MSKCNNCEFKKRHHTGSDEYPANTTIEYCSKGHWEGGDIPIPDEVDFFDNCKDYKQHDTTRD